MLIRWAHSLQIKSAKPSPRSMWTMQPQQSAPTDACSRIIGIALQSLHSGQDTSEAAYPIERSVPTVSVRIRAVCSRGNVFLSRSFFSFVSSRRSAAK